MVARKGERVPLKCLHLLDSGADPAPRAIARGGDALRRPSPDPAAPHGAFGGDCAVDSK